MSEQRETAGDRTETWAAVLLGVAATLTALSAYGSALAGGEELAAFTDANAQLADANFFYQQGNQTLADDNRLFLAYLEALERGGETVFIEELMRPELAAAIEDWQVTDELLTPFESEAYEIDAFAQAEADEADSAAALERAEDEGGEGDELDLANVVFAVALFAAGIVQTFRRAALRRILLGVSLALTVGGTGVMALALL